MSKRVFPHHPAGTICPICGTDRDCESVLVGIDGTGDGSIEEAQPTHLGCLLAAMRYRRDMGAYYAMASSSPGEGDEEDG